MDTVVNLLGIINYVVFLRSTVLIFLINQFLGTSLPNPLYCPNKCGRCYKGEFRKENLGQHLRYQCGRDKCFECFQCGKRYTWKRDLVTHCALKHDIMIFQ